MGGGSKTSSTTTNNNYDPVASAAATEIAQRQQEMGEEQWAMYKNFFLPYEVEYAKSLNATLPASTQATIAEEQSKTRDLELSRPIQEKFYSEVAKGPQYQDAMGRATTDVVAGYNQAEAQGVRNLTRMGLNPNEVTPLIGLSAGDKARDIATARTKAYNAETDAYLGRAVGALGVRDKVYAAPNQFNLDSYKVNSPANTGAALMGQAGNTQTALASRVMSSSSKQRESGGGGFGAILGQVAGTAIGLGGAYGVNKLMK